MRTQFYNRQAARSDYICFRKTWGRQAAFWLTVAQHCTDWRMRVAATLTLIACGIPPNGKYQENRR